MKHSYNKALLGLAHHKYWLAFLLVLLPFLGIAQTFTVTPADNSSPQNFGSVAVGTSSASKSYVVSGNSFSAGQTISVALSGTQYGISQDNVNFSNSAFDLVADNDGNITATVYARFSPTSQATINRTLSFSSDFSESAAAYSLRGTGTAGSPAITVNPAALGFGAQEVNTTSAAMTFAVNGTSLGTTPITITAPTGFAISYNNSNYSSTASIAPVNGSVTNQIVSVVFKPTAAQSYVNTISLSSSTASNSVSVSGTGRLPTPIITATPNTLDDFGQVIVGTSSSVIRSFAVEGQNLQGNVTITPPAGFSIRIGSNFFSTNAITLSPSSGMLARTSIDVRFNPTVAQPYDSNISVESTNATAQLVRVSGEGIASAGTPVVRLDPGSIAFGTVTSSGSTSTRSFEVSGTDLTGPIVLTPSNSNIELRNAATGGAFLKSLSISPVNGTVSAQNIEVRLVATIARGAFSERIAITSTDADDTEVSITASNPSGTTSDISVFNPDNNPFTFVTRPNTFSASQSFLVSGNNLVQPLVVQPVGPNAEYFEVSKDNNAFFASVSFTPDGDGTVTAQRIYARFKPGVQAVTVTSTIRNTSAPAPDFDVSVTGISEPTIRLNNLIGDYATNVVKGTQTAPKAVQLDGFLLNGPVEVRFPADATDATRNPDQIPQYEFSLDGGSTYVKSTTITPDANGNFSNNLLVRFAPVRVGNANQELQFRNASFGTNYFSLNSGFGRVTGFAIAVEPTAQSTARVVRSADGRSAAITFSLSNPPAGASYGATRLIIGSSTYTLFPSNLFPQDKANFNPGTTYGTGTVIEESSNTYVVFSGANATYTVTGLDPALPYYFFGFEFNNDGLLNAENYLVPNNQPLFPLPVELKSFTAKLSKGRVKLDWVTASEKNNKGFEVQRSQDGEQFTVLQFVNGHGSKSNETLYTTLDAQPLGGTSYYRLKQVDHDGTFAYSPVVAVANAQEARDVTFYPNPTHDVLHIVMSESVGARVTLTDLTGKVLLTTTLDASNSVSLAALHTGTYLVSVETSSQKVTRKVVKE